MIASVRLSGWFSYFTDGSYGRGLVGLTWAPSGSLDGIGYTPAILSTTYLAGCIESGERPVMGDPLLGLTLDAVGLLAFDNQPVGVVLRRGQGVRLYELITLLCGHRVVHLLNASS